MNPIAEECIALIAKQKSISPEKIRLALRNVRRNGYALCDQELEVGLRSIAVPVTAPPA